MKAGKPGSRKAISAQIRTIAKFPIIVGEGFIPRKDSSEKQYRLESKEAVNGSWKARKLEGWKARKP